MVMSGDEAKSVILGKDGLVSNMKAGGAVLLTATIKPNEESRIAEAVEGSGINLIDSPVSARYPGAQSGTLTLMAAEPDGILEQFAPVMEAVSGTIHRVGEKAGMGKTVKTCLQTLIGSIFSVTFEAYVLTATAGVKR